jgi:surface protein
MFKGFCTDPDVWNYDFSNWDTRKVTDMSYMFKAIEYYEGNYWEITKNVAIDLSSLDTSAVLNMSHMFEGAGKNATSFSLNLSGFDTSNVQNMSYMLYGMGKNASSLSVNISGWNVSNVTNHQYFSDRLEIIQPNWP